MMTPTPIAATSQVPVFFATTEGHTRRIAERIATVLTEEGFDSCAIDIASPSADAFDWAHARGAVVGASLHGGTHQKTATTFVRTHAAQLNAHPSAFFSVSLSAASSRPEEVEAAWRLARAFPAAFGWNPLEIVSIAGCLAYTQYGLLKRFLMSRIARHEGGPTDTRRDYDLTNWTMVDRLGRDVAGLIRDVEWSEQHREPAAGVAA